MASVATPYGLRAVNRLDGLPYAGATRLFPIASGYATNIFNGDIVSFAAGTITRTSGTTTLTNPIGVFVGVTYTDPNLKYKVFRQYYPASTAASDIQAYVVDDPSVLFQIQASAAVVAANIGKNAGIVNTAGSTVTGNSAITLDAATIAVTATHPLRLVDYVNGPTSALGDAFTDVLVKWNAGIHMYENATGA